MRLSKQSIRKLCVDTDTPMIHPFEPSKVRVQGVSKGLSHASYDASIAHDLVLGRHPGYVIKEWVESHFGTLADSPETPLPSGFLACVYRIPKVVLTTYKMLSNFADLAHKLRIEPPAYALAHTIEDFHMPDNVGGDVADKSTFARVFVSAYNTFFDPGFHGNATLELVNDSDKRVEYKAGQGVCQFIFTWLDEATEEPYSGKYQGQGKRPQPAIFEKEPVRLAGSTTAQQASRRAKHYAEQRAAMAKHRSEQRAEQHRPLSVTTEDLYRRDSTTGESEIFRDGKWVESKPDGDGVRMTRYEPAMDTRNRHEVEADKNRQQRHGVDEKPVHYGGEVGSHHRRNAAEKTLLSLGYTWNGGVEWKPPLGKVPAYIQEGDLEKIWQQGYGIVQKVEGTDQHMAPELDPSKIRGNGRVELDPVDHEITTRPIAAGGPTPHAPVAVKVQPADMEALARYRWGDRPAGLDKYAGQPDHAVRGWEPK